jgi:hypothetical protein
LEALKRICICWAVTQIRSQLCTQAGKMFLKPAVLPCVLVPRRLEALVLNDSSMTTMVILPVRSGMRKNQSGLIWYR